MSVDFYHVLHVFSLLVLTGYTFYAFAAPAESRKRVLMITGIASLLVLISGFGLLAKLKYGFPGWIIVKLVCWLGLSAFSGIAFRKREKVGVFTVATLVLLLVALVMVYYRPF